MNSFRTAVLGLLLCFLAAQANAENSDSSKYWVNRAYLTCLEQNRSVCDCQSEQEYLILAVDTAARTIMAEPSIFFSWEDLQFEIVPVIGKKGFYKVPLTYGIDSFATIETGSNRLRLRSRTQAADFVPFIMQNSSDPIQAILNHIHAYPLQRYRLVALPPEIPPFDTSEFQAYFKNHLVNIMCTDDFHYNQMWIRRNDSIVFNFFMVYQAKEILLYQIPPRSRRQAVDVSRLTPCFKFLKPE